MCAPPVEVHTKPALFCSTAPAVACPASWQTLHLTARPSELGGWNTESSSNNKWRTCALKLGFSRTTAALQRAGPLEQHCRAAVQHGGCARGSPHLPPCCCCIMACICDSASLDSSPNRMPTRALCFMNLVAHDCTHCSAVKGQGRRRTKQVLC